MKIFLRDYKNAEGAFEVRKEVFVLEQKVPLEIEMDQEDFTATHLVATENGTAIGSARIIFSKTDAHFGRLAVKKKWRGKGVGLKILNFLVEHCFGLGYETLWLNSQLHAAPFYEKVGFERVGEVFFEAGIEHIKMELKRKV